MSESSKREGGTVVLKEIREIYRRRDEDIDRVER